MVVDSDYRPYYVRLAPFACWVLIHRVLVHLLVSTRLAIHILSHASMGTVGQCSEMNGYTSSTWQLGLGVGGTLVRYRTFALGQRWQINLPDPIVRLAYKAVPKDASDDSVITGHDCISNDCNHWNQLTDNVIYSDSGFVRSHKDNLIHTRQVTRATHHI